MKSLRGVLASIKSTELNYGRDIISDLSTSRASFSGPGAPQILDVGCSGGSDLLNLNEAFGGRCALYGIECDARKAAASQDIGINMASINIERDVFPFQDAFFDIVIINQVIEHVKELFWVFSEISRVLRPGGICIVGTVNLASLHNRLLLLCGAQPTSIEVLGPHVRGFTAGSFKRFIETDGYFEVLEVRGSNFYPFPPAIARHLSRLLPRMSVALFFLLKRQARPGTFVHVLDSRDYETPYFRGEIN